MTKKGRPSNRDMAWNAVLERTRKEVAWLPDDDVPRVLPVLLLPNGDACGRSACVIPHVVAPAETFMSFEETHAIYGCNPETRRHEDGSPVEGRRPRSESFNELVLRIWSDDRLLDWVQYVHALRHEWLSWPADHEKPFPDFVRSCYAMDKGDPVPPREPEPRLYSVVRREEELPGGGKGSYSERTKVPLFTLSQLVAWYEGERVCLTGGEKRPAEEIAHRILRKLVSTRFDEAGDTLPSISDLRRSSLRRKR